MELILELDLSFGALVHSFGVIVEYYTVIVIQHLYLDFIMIPSTPWFRKLSLLGLVIIIINTANSLPSKNVIAQYHTVDSQANTVLFGRSGKTSLRR
jgi:hypothetical protein